jgi:hypothetical protein
MSDEPGTRDSPDGESESVHAPRRDPDPPTGSRVQPAAWLVGIGVLVVLTLGFLVAWGVGMLDLPG